MKFPAGGANVTVAPATIARPLYLAPGAMVTRPPSVVGSSVARKNSSALTIYKAACVGFAVVDKNAEAGAVKENNARPVLAETDVIAPVPPEMPFWRLPASFSSKTLLVM